MGGDLERMLPLRGYVSRPPHPIAREWGNRDPLQGRDARVKCPMEGGLKWRFPPWGKDAGYLEPVEDDFGQRFPPQGKRTLNSSVPLGKNQEEGSSHRRGCWEEVSPGVLYSFLMAATKMPGKKQL